MCATLAAGRKLATERGTIMKGSCSSSCDSQFQLSLASFKEPHNKSKYRSLSEVGSGAEQNDGAQVNHLNDK